MFPIKSLPLLGLLGLLMSLTASADNLEQSNAEEMLGNGWQVPGTGLNLGGYASGGYNDDRGSGQWNADMDDLSLFIRWEGEGKLRLFSELGLQRPMEYDPGTGFTTRHAYLALERLYADYLYSDELILRGGKYLTPIGRWNLIHAAPLVWTTSRPLITEYSFPTNATGVMAYGTVSLLGLEVDYSVYSAVGPEWRPDPRLDPFREANGLHLNATLGRAGQLGFSYASFEQKSAKDEHRNLFGLDYTWSHDRYEVMAEGIYRVSDDGSQKDERGLYVQTAIPLSARLHGIVRYELYDQAGPAPAMNLWLGGLAYRLTPNTLLKAEYSHATHNTIDAPEGIFTSFAILF